MTAENLPTSRAFERMPRITADAEDLGRGLGQLVVALLELVRDLLERQAIRRMDGGDLTELEIERLGQALLELDEKFTELREAFGVERDGLKLPVDVDELLGEDRRNRLEKEESAGWL